jgi:hypothetical protein
LTDGKSMFKIEDLLTYKKQMGKAYLRQVEEKSYENFLRDFKGNGMLSDLEQKLSNISSEESRSYKITQKSGV